METGCGGLHVLLRAAANSCKDMVVDYKRREISFIATFVTETEVLEENSAYSYLGQR